MELRSEEHNQLQLVDRDEIDDEEELFEMIDKCKWFCIKIYSLLISCIVIFTRCF